MGLHYFLDNCDTKKVIQLKCEEWTENTLCINFSLFDTEISSMRLADAYIDLYLRISDSSIIILSHNTKIKN